MAKKSSTGISSCEIGVSKKTPERATHRCAFYKHLGDFKWRGIREEAYKSDDGSWSGISRKVLIGSRGETANFHVRYFEISPKGYSSLETHAHEHAVICVRGKGVVRTGRREKKIGFMDTVYIAPNSIHQLRNPFDTPFGFLCIVDSDRDQPKILRNKARKIQ